MPYPELKLWLRIKNKQLKGYKFRRQYSIGNYVVDFYCQELKLAVEVDGDSHYNEASIEYDKAREKYLQKFGIRIIRFSNEEVKDNIDGVLERIMSTINTSPHPSL